MDTSTFVILVLGIFLFVNSSVLIFRDRQYTRLLDKFHDLEDEYLVAALRNGYSICSKCGETYQPLTGETARKRKIKVDKTLCRACLHEELDKLETATSSGYCDWKIEYKPVKDSDLAKKAGVIVESEDK